jgi:poly(hydroxyalkanoate) granule-associated protein
MATEQLRDQVKKQLDDVTKSAHEVFLAGLGAAALTQEEGGRLFDRLVSRGRKVEAEGKKKVTAGKKQLDAVTKKANKAVAKIQGEVEGRLHKAVNRLGIPNQDQIRLLTERVAELTRKVEGLSRPAAAKAR